MGGGEVGGRWGGDVFFFLRSKDWEDVSPMCVREAGIMRRLHGEGFTLLQHILHFQNVFLGVDELLDLLCTLGRIFQLHKSRPG